jgi:hypothetical protein
VRYETRVVAGAVEGTSDFECACGFTSREWPTKKLALKRGMEHAAEHETGEPARELVEFRTEHGLNGPLVELVKFKDAEAEK